MSPAGPKGKKRKKKPGPSTPPPRGRGGRSNASSGEGDDEGIEISGVPAKRTNAQANKEMWTQGKKGLSDLWESYVQLLQRDFGKRSRESQEQLILRLSQVITIGCVVVLLNFFYPFIPSLIRLFVFPLMLVASWFVATRAIAPMIVVRFEDRLNPSEDYEDENS